MNFSRILIGAWGALLVAAIAWSSGDVRAGDATYGSVVGAKNGNVIVFKHATGSYDVVLAGIVPPKDRAFDEQSRRFLQSRSEGKLAQFRLDGRGRDGRLVGKIHLEVGDGRVVDLGVELVRQGLGTADPRYAGYKYGELQAAMREAREKKAGLWAAPQR